MQKIFRQALVLVLIFVVSFFILSQIDLMELFTIRQKVSDTEEKLGDLLLADIRDSEEAIADTFILAQCDSILNKICRFNEIDHKLIKLHLLKKDEVNAYALPDGHLIIFKGLLQEVDSPEQLSGVIGHELAHIDLNHVMQKLAKEVGFAVLVSMTSAGGGGEMVKEVSRLLSSSAFDRSLEKEADIQSVEYMKRAKIDVRLYANFLFRLSTERGKSNAYWSWLSTHPDLEERAKYILEERNVGDYESEELISTSNWQQFKEHLDSL
jgi:predicted Zn-dependent protease